MRIFIVFYNWTIEVEKGDGQKQIAGLFLSETDAKVFAYDTMIEQLQYDPGLRMSIEETLVR